MSVIPRPCFKKLFERKLFAFIQPGFLVFAIGFSLAPPLFDIDVAAKAFLERLLVALHHRLTAKNVAANKEAYSMRSAAGVRPYTIAIAIAWRASNSRIGIVCRNVSFRERTYVDAWRARDCVVFVT